MPDDQLFRIVLLIGFAAVLPFSIYFRMRSASSRDKLDRRQEGLFILLTLRPIALAGMARLLTFLVSPRLMAWSSVRRGMSTLTAAVVANVIVAQVLTAVERFVRRYVVLTADQAAAVSLWVAHTQALDAFECTPYLHVTSATKRAGKTLLLEALELIVAEPWLTGRTSVAALARKVSAEQLTLLLDASDAAFGGEWEYAEAGHPEQRISTIRSDNTLRWPRPVGEKPQHLRAEGDRWDRPTTADCD